MLIEQKSDDEVLVVLKIEGTRAELRMLALGLLDAGEIGKKVIRVDGTKVVLKRADT